MPPLSQAYGHAAAAQPAVETAEFSPDERRFLLQVARQAILSVFTRSQSPVETTLPRLLQQRAVFTSLRLAGELRGCVGQLAASQPLPRAVAEAAIAAAFADPRFGPLTAAEAGAIRISISVLSPLFPIVPAAIEIGRHGLLVAWGSQRGLLLPQVPLQFAWDSQTFLEQTCRKAGLPNDAWRSGAELMAFTAETFEEEN